MEKTCASRMDALRTTCSTGSFQVHVDDSREPWGDNWPTNPAQYNNQCCRKHCRPEMKLKGLSCAPPYTIRGRDDWTDPYQDGNTNNNLLETCCVTNCEMVFDNRTLSCPAGKRLRSRDDWHDPFSRGTADADVVQECCRGKLPWSWQRKNIQCDASSEVRGYDDWHMPFGNDWSQSAATIKSQVLSAAVQHVTVPNRHHCEERLQYPR